MKKSLSIFLTLCMVLGIGLCGLVGASAASISWPPAGAMEIFVDEPVSEDAASTYLYFVFKPAVTAKYTFEFTAVSISGERLLVTDITILDKNAVRYSATAVFYPDASRKVKIECSLEANKTYYYAVVTGSAAQSYDCLVTRTGDASWWLSVPGWLQWILRWILFGWIWMK